MIMKRKMKITAAIAAATLLVMSMAGCGDEKTSGGSADAAKQDAYQIGIIQQLEHPALDEATEGFKQALIDKLGEDGVSFEEENAQNEVTNCATILSLIHI